MKNKSLEHLLDKKIIKYLFVITGLVLFVMYFSYVLMTAASLWKITRPLVIGFVIAYVLNILMKKIERLYFPNATNSALVKSRRPVSLLLSITIVILVLILVVNIVLPQVFNTFSSIASAFPSFINRVNQWILEYEQNFPAIAEQINLEQISTININWESIVRSVVNYTTRGISSIFSSSINLISIFTSGLFDLFISFTFAIYLLIGKENLLSQLRRMQKAFMKAELASKVNYVLSVAHESFTSFITGQCTEALILGALCTLGMIIFRFPYATTVGVFIGATALIPVVGAYLGAGVGAFLILMVDPVKAAMFLVYVVILQQLENSLIYPKVVGTSIGLPGVFVLVAVVIGGGLGGIIGMLIGVPAAATVYKLLQAATHERLCEAE